MKQTKRVFIKTFGCQMNEYDSARMIDVLAADESIERTDQPEEADVILFNTCSVREKAQEKVFSDLGLVKSLKRAKPDLVIGVGGCVASQEGQAIVARAPYVDIVFGPQTLHRLPELIRARRGTGQPQVDVSFPEIEKFDHMPPPRVEGPTAFVSIMEGCSKYCSFCVVPYTRGEEISRPFDDVIAEIAELAEGGVREVSLLGQNVNAYRGAMAEGEWADLALLLEYVHEVPGIERIRYTTSHPKEFTQRLVDAQVAPAELAPIELADGLLGVLIVHLDEAEAARATGLPVGHDGGRVHRADRREQVPQIVFGGTPGEISHVDLLHQATLRARIGSGRNA